MTNDTERPPLNVALMEATMARIIAEPESWDQSDTINVTDCGTTFCFAGHAALLAGAQLVDGAIYLRMPKGEPGDIMDFAQKHLGLTRDEARDLFYNFTRDVDTLHRHVKQIIESRQSEATP